MKGFQERFLAWHSPGDSQYSYQTAITAPKGDKGVRDSAGDSQYSYQTAITAPKGDKGVRDSAGDSQYSYQTAITAPKGDKDVRDSDSYSYAFDACDKDKSGERASKVCCMSLSMSIKPLQKRMHCWRTPFLPFMSFFCVDPTSQTLQLWWSSNGPRFESARGRCVESLDKALYSHCPKEKPSR